MIYNPDTDEYLVYRGKLLQLRKGYFWKAGKAGASYFDRGIAQKIVVELKRTGFLNAKKVVAK